MSETVDLDSPEILELLGTDPRDISGETHARLASACSGATLDRLASACSGATLDRMASACSGETLDRMASACSGETLARMASACSDATLARLAAAASGATLARLAAFDPPVLPRPYTRVMEVTRDCSVNFNMDSWHCGTTHCLAGTLVDLAGLTNSAVEKRIGTPLLATLILRKSRPGTPLPNFYATNEQARAFIRARERGSRRSEGLIMRHPERSTRAQQSPPRGRNGAYAAWQDQAESLRQRVAESQAARRAARSASRLAVVAWIALFVACAAGAVVATWWINELMIRQ